MLEIDPVLFPSAMLTPSFSRNPVVFVEITAPTAVRGEHLAVGDIIEIPRSEAAELISNFKGRIVDPPAGAEQADAADGKPARKRAPKPEKPT